VTESTSRPRLIVAAMLISTFMAAIEVTVISIAMPTIVAKLGGFSLFSWTFGIYLLTQAVMTPLYGRLADSFGRKAVYLWSTGLFLLGSLLCGLSWNMESLILFRAIQGIGGGALAPLATTIIGDVCKPEDRARVMGYGSGIWGIAALTGPLLGAFFVNTLGWPFVFWVNLPIGVITIAMVLRFLHEPASGKTGAPIDLLGAGLLILGVGAMMVALVQFEEMARLALAAILVVSVLALIAFALRERQVLHPLLPLHLLRRPLILAAQASALLAGGMLIGLTAFLPAWVQGVEGGSALQSGIALGVLTVSWTASSMTIGRSVGRGRDRAIAIGAGLLMVLGSLGLLLIGRGHGLGLLYIVSVPLGAGMGLTSLVFMIAVQSGVAHVDRGRATALFYFSRLIGQAVGAAAFGGVLNSGLAGAGTHDALRALVNPARRASLPPMELDRLTGLLGAALHGVFILSAVLAVGALIAALVVPRKRPLSLVAGGG
jgi:EmrB/QacA subfamily drug resistance transporter